MGADEAEPADVKVGVDEDEAEHGIVAPRSVKGLMAVGLGAGPELRRTPRRRWRGVEVRGDDE